MAHPVPAPSGQPASIGAEATAAYGSLMFPELSATGEVFCFLCQCQQLPWPEAHCEIFCIGKREKGRVPERGSETGPQGQRQSRVSTIFDDSESQAVDNLSDKGQSSYEVTGQGHQALPALALQLSNSLLHLQTLLFSSDHYHLDQVSYLERTKTTLHFHLKISPLNVRETQPYTQQSLHPGRNSEDYRDYKEVPESGFGNKKKQSRLMMQEKCI